MVGEETGFEKSLVHHLEETNALRRSLIESEQKLSMLKQTARADFVRLRAAFEAELAEALQTHRSLYDIRAVQQEEKISDLEILKDRLQADLLHFAEALREMKENRDQSDAEREALQDELVLYKRRVNDLERSTSWKITRPMRVVIRLLKQLLWLPPVSQEVSDRPGL